MSWYGFETKDEANSVQLFESLCMTIRMAVAGNMLPGIAPGVQLEPHLNTFRKSPILPIFYSGNIYNDLLLIMITLKG
jgi:hypothetical protein